jgi:hypothetical protein
MPFSLPNLFCSEIDIAPSFVNFIAFRDSPEVSEPLGEIPGSPPFG